MTNPLRVMDPQVSLREYLLEANLPNPGPFVMIDEDNAVRRIAKELGQDLPPEACYLEQLWVRVDPTPVDGGGGGGGSTNPDWVPADAKIHIDFIGGTPQGRAWVDGTGDVAIDTLLGSDPNTEMAWGTGSYDPAHLSVNGYSNSDAGVIAVIGVLRSRLLAGATSRYVFKVENLCSPSPLILMSADGEQAVEIDYRETDPFSIDASSWGGSLALSLANVANSGVGDLNIVSVTLVPDRIDMAMNGSTAVTSALTTDDFPTSGISPLVAGVVDITTTVDHWLQSITVYDPLSTTDGLSELSEP